MHWRTYGTVEKGSQEISLWYIGNIDASLSTRKPFDNV